MVLYDRQRADLSKNFEVITPDLRGFGKSTIPNATATDALYARDMFALLDHFGIKRAIIGGHSMGGQVTLEMYREQPQRFLGMILFDTNPMAPSIVEQAEFTAFGMQAEQIGTPSIVSRITPQMLTGYERLFDAPRTLEMMDILAEGSPNGVAGGGQALAGRIDYTSLLPKITVPTLVVVGVNDPIYSLEISETTASAIPGSLLTIIPDAEHASMFEQPEIVDAVIREWSRQVLPY